MPLLSGFRRHFLTTFFISHDISSSSFRFEATAFSFACFLSRFLLRTFSQDFLILSQPPAIVFIFASASLPDGPR